jgi:uncharacterized protein YraI
MPLISSSRVRLKNGRAILLPAFLSLMAAPAPASAAERYVKVVNVMPGHVLWLRSGPGFHFERVGFLPHRARHVRAYTCKRLATGSWCQVRYHGTRAWGSQLYLADDTTRIAREPGRGIPSRFGHPMQLLDPSPATERPMSHLLPGSGRMADGDETGTTQGHPGWSR